MLESPPFLMVSSDTRFVAGFYKLYFPYFEYIIRVGISPVALTK